MTSIAKLRKANYMGNFRAALSEYLHSESATPPNSRSFLLHRCYYALTLQSAGLLKMAYEAWTELETDVRRRRSVSKGDFDALDDILVSIGMQRSVLLQRLGHDKLALRLMPSRRKCLEARDPRFAKASLISWRLLTRFWLYEHIPITTLIREAKLALDGTDVNCKLWARVFLAAIGEPGSIPLDVLVSDMERFDAPGSPWVCWFAARLLQWQTKVKAKSLSPDTTRRILDILYLADRLATAYSKFFVIAQVNEAIAELLHRSKLENFDRIASPLKRSIAAYARCQLILYPNFRARLYSLSSEILGKREATNSFLRGLNILIPNEKIFIGRVCSAFAERDTKSPDAVFEEFVQDWGGERIYHHEVGSVPSGTRGIDHVFIREQNGQRLATVVQSKLYNEPRQVSYIKPNPVPGLVRENYDAKVEQYILVLATNNPAGWNATMWNSQDTSRLRDNFDTHHISFRIVLEPELRNDIVMSDRLLNKWFSSVSIDVA
jgi:hypothetical protein